MNEHDLWLAQTANEQMAYTEELIEFYLARDHRIKKNKMGIATRNMWRKPELRKQLQRITEAQNEEQANSRKSGRAGKGD